MKNALRLALLSLIFLLSSPFVDAAINRSVILTNVTVFTGQKFLPKKQTVVIENGVYREISATDSKAIIGMYPNLPVVDGSGKVLSPGFMDSEYHYISPKVVAAQFAGMSLQEGAPIVGPKGEILRVYQPVMFRALVDLGLMKDRVPFSHIYGHSKGENFEGWMDYIFLHQSQRFGVTAVFDMQSNPSLTELPRLSRDMREMPTSIHEHNLNQEFMGLSSLYTSSWWAVPMHYFPDYGTPLIRNFEEGGTQDDVTRWISARLREGASYIKVYYDDKRAFRGEPAPNRPVFSTATLKAIIDTAHRFDLKVVTHALSLNEAKTALELGTDGLMHIAADKLFDEEIIALLKRNNAFIIPSLSTLMSSLPGDLNNSFARKYYATDARVLNDKRLQKYILPHLTTLSELRLESPDQFPESFDRYSIFYENAAIAWANGIPLLAGSDASGIEPVVEGFTVHQEMWHIQNALRLYADLSKEEAVVEALKAATSNPAAIFGNMIPEVKKMGIVAEGKYADFVLLDGDPRDWIRNTLKISDVYKNGERMLVRDTPIRARPFETRKVLNLHRKDLACESSLRK